MQERQSPGEDNAVSNRITVRNVLPSPPYHLVVCEDEAGRHEFRTFMESANERAH